ncbi:hypothetical protein ASC63_09725 [Leifsonia sp. Root112D2]|nr:hypothetical protein ASC63_09725 [Leifsonia sp. Root112D2]
MISSEPLTSAATQRVGWAGDAKIDIAGFGQDSAGLSVYAGPTRFFAAETEPPKLNGPTPSKSIVHVAGSEETTVGVGVGVEDGV